MLLSLAFQAAAQRLLRMLELSHVHVQAAHFQLLLSQACLGFQQLFPQGSHLALQDALVLFQLPLEGLGSV